jgi:hypothetical protein
VREARLLRGRTLDRIAAAEKLQLASLSKTCYSRARVNHQYAAAATRSG